MTTRTTAPVATTATKAPLPGRAPGSRRGRATAIAFSRALAPRRCPRARSGLPRSLAVATWDPSSSSARGASAPATEVRMEVPSTPDPSSGPARGCPKRPLPQTRVSPSATRTEPPRTPTRPLAGPRASPWPAPGSCRPPCPGALPPAWLGSASARGSLLLEAAPPRAPSRDRNPGSSRPRPS